PEDRKSKVLAQQSMQHLLFHELGHIFVYRYVPRSLKKDTEFKALFGDLTKQYRRKLSRLRTHPDFISNYAQSHPEENFCEVFAVYCAHEGKIRKMYEHLKKHKKSDKVKKQAFWIHKFVKKVRNQR
ncbi:MAG: putative zinc-binding metallopeptidase, partial [Candidatus Nanoarchaeia archaeon]